MWLTLKLLIYSLQENPQDHISSHNRIISFNKNKVSGNQEAWFTKSSEFISNKLAMFNAIINTIIFYYTRKRWNIGNRNLARLLLLINYDLLLIFITNKITRSFNVVLLSGINNSNQYIIKIYWPNHFFINTIIFYYTRKRWNIGNRNLACLLLLINYDLLLIFITNKITRSFNVVLLSGINNSNQYVIKIYWYFGYIFQ